MTIEDLITKIDRVKHLEDTIASLEFSEKFPLAMPLFGDYLSAVSDGSSIEALRAEREEILKTEI